SLVSENYNPDRIPVRTCCAAFSLLTLGLVRQCNRYEISRCA
ncbi:unnamed protein product, partial [Choristocarpus tenellus]